MKTPSPRLSRWLTAALAALLALITTIPSQADETVTYIHWDALGSPVAATDVDGNVVWREAYRPYGERINNEAAADSHSRWYTGHPQDDDTGLVYAGARYYDPVIGRFFAIDPVDFQEDNLHSFNRYAYANNNPYRFVDPDGRLPILAPVAVFVAKEAIAEIGSRLTGGATDLLSTRRMLTRAGKSLGRLFTKNAGSVTKGAGPKAGSAGGEGAKKVFPNKVQDQARKESNDTCVFCGTKTTREPGPTRSEIDHSIPKSRGGNNTIENAQNTCRTCNRSKGAKTTDEFLNQ